MQPADELRAAAAEMRRGRGRKARYAAELAELLDAIADISTDLTTEPYAGTWQGRGLAVARAILRKEAADATR